MQAFFSSTDNTALLQEGESRNHFLSLVVNNNGNYVARVTSKINVSYIIDGTIKYNTFNNEVVEEVVEKTPKSKTLINVYNLNIIKNNTLCDDYDELMQRIKECEETKKTRKEREFVKSNEIPFYFSNTNLYKTPVTNSNNSTSSVSTNIQSLAKRILTLSLIDTDVDINKFVNSMSDTMSKRFPKEGDYKMAMQTICDYLIDYELLNELEESFIKDVDAAFYEKINSLIDYLLTFPQNPYINEIITYLSHA